MNINIDGLNINYIDVGEGKPIVMLHGWGSSLDAFRLITDCLSSGRRVIALDFPGFGGSDMIGEPWSVEDYCQFTLKFFDALDLHDPDLICHSFGGRIVIKLCGSGRLNPEKIVLMDAAGIKNKPSVKSRVRTAAFKTGKFLLTLPIVRNFSRSALDRLRAHFGSADYNSAPPVLRSTLVKVVNEDLRDYLKNIKASALLIWGDLDTATPLSDAKLMEREISDCGLCVIKGTGHFSFIERPAQVNAILLSFFGG
ncbi:MAG: alpha/beta hydrolase [Firmicutes bacterium]|nr:alpha/beta hydrolase [Bacillota bacterium]